MEFAKPHFNPYRQCPWTLNRPQDLEFLINSRVALDVISINLRLQ